MSSMVDWSTLPKDLLNIISKSLESSFDLIHFRSVCSSWRSAAEPKRPLPTHHIPILPDNGVSLFPDSAVGFRLSQRSILLIKPVREADSFGWLIKVEEDLNGPRKVMTILDPLSDKRNSIPEQFPRVLDMSKFKIRELGCEFKLRYFNRGGDIVDSLYLEKAVVKYLDYSDVDESKFVLLTIHVSGKLAVYRSWDRAWTVINDMPSPYDDVILFDGRFFAVDNNGRTVVVDFSSLKLTLAANPVFGGDKKFLIDSCGVLLLVDMYLSLEVVDGDPGFVEELFEQLVMNERTVKFKVFKFVEGEKSWVDVHDLGDKMLFLGDDSTFSATASQVIPSSGGGSSVFFNGNVFNGEGLGAMQEDRDLGVFDFTSGKIELVHKLPVYAYLFWPPPPWITSQPAEDHT